jgi:hypothetical protein
VERRGLFASIRRELRAWRREAQLDGAKVATLRRLQHHAGTTRLTAETRAHLETLYAQIGRLDRLESLASIAQVMAWIEHAHLAGEPLASVIVPTRNRAGVLPQALGSVVTQTYPNWELVVVDDGSEDSTPEVLASYDDPRVRSLTVAPGGVNAARNAGLEAARGELIAYLDDDNLMHPGWLKAVAWAFEQRPDADVLYGAIAIDVPSRVGDARAGEMPGVFLSPFDRQRLAEGNVADMSTIAHRAAIPNARFDEALATMGDWDLLIRLSAARQPLALPAIACFYRSDAGDRLTGSPTEELDRERVRVRARATVPES